MADTHSKKVRSYNMSRIRATNTSPELIVRKFLFKEGFRFRLHSTKLPGKPDIILPKYKTIIFVHGCFWHCHKNCSYFVLPKSRKNYWIPKLEGNLRRDQKIMQELKKLGWKTLIVWECRLKNTRREKELAKLARSLKAIKTIL